MEARAPHLAFETIHGSQAYGLARAGSDEDLKGVVVGPPAWYLGFQGGPEQVELGPDHVRFELRKFMRLAAAGNPTLLEVLFTAPEDHRVCSPVGARLLAARGQFLSRRVEQSFAGYAQAQLKRIHTHRRWLMEPPTEAPTREAFGLPPRAVAPPEQIGAAAALQARGELGEADVSANFLGLLDAERRYRAARQTWQQYQAWLRGRNPTRAALEARYGYDTKHGLHLVRLLRMGAEILEAGEVRVRRADREELLAIRDGAWPIEALLEQADALGERVRVAAERTHLPAAPDEAALDALCTELVAQAWALEGWA